MVFRHPNFIGEYKKNDVRVHLFFNAPTPNPSRANGRLIQ